MHVNKKQKTKQNKKRQDIQSSDFEVSFTFNYPLISKDLIN
jgi:hexokinase